MRKAMTALAAMAAAPAGAATIVVLPLPGSMASPRVFLGEGDPDEVYVCTLPTEPGGGHCSLHHARPRRRL
jgi:hypothetical protein